MIEFEEKKGVICIKNNKQQNYYKSLAIFSKEKYEEEDLKAIIINCTKNQPEKIIKKIFVPEIQLDKNNDLVQEYNKYINYKRCLDDNNINKLKKYIHKYRPYLKIVKPNIDNIKEETNILTFILFNPSTANHYELDDTIINCAYLTFNKTNYNGFEILNLFDIRDPRIDLILQKIDNNICISSNFSYEGIICKNIYLGWGCSNNKFSKEIRINLLKEAFFKLYEKFKEKYERLFVLNEPNDNEDVFRTWHFGNQCWNSKHLPFKKNILNNTITYHQKDRFNGEILILKNGFIKFIEN